MSFSRSLKEKAIKVWEEGYNHPDSSADKWELIQKTADGVIYDFKNAPMPE